MKGWEGGDKSLLMLPLKNATPWAVSSSFSHFGITLLRPDLIFLL
jgi:hypothetical protein